MHKRKRLNMVQLNITTLKVSNYIQHNSQNKDLLRAHVDLN